MFTSSSMDIGAVAQAGGDNVGQLPLGTAGKGCKTASPKQF